MKDEQEKPGASSTSSPRSEFDFINSLRQRLGSLTSQSLVAGIGDDAAVFRNAAGKESVITTDLLVEDVDFRRTTTPPYLLGHKALAVSLSDIAAMGARPLESPRPPPRWRNALACGCTRIWPKRGMRKPSAWRCSGAGPWTTCRIAAGCPAAPGSRPAFILMTTKLRASRRQARASRIARAVTRSSHPVSAGSVTWKLPASVSAWAWMALPQTTVPI